MERLPLDVQTLYSELLERLVALEAERSVGAVPGCFVTKTVKGNVYCYFQQPVPGGSPRQVYVGRREPVLERVVRRHREQGGFFKSTRKDIQRLCAALRAGGVGATDPPTAKVLSALADAGVFRLGGVLVGTQAFRVLGNLLGVRWTSGSLRTQDVDIAAEAQLAVAVPFLEADVPSALESLDLGFLPVPPFDPRHPSTSFKVRGKALRVDLLTPAASSAQRTPVYLPRLKAAAQPVPMLDLLVAEPVRGAVVGGEGVLVNVPSPGRFALHKLWVSRRRDAASQAKAGKDLFQALEVLEVLVEDRPGDLVAAWEAAPEAGTWRSGVREGLDALARAAPDTARRVREVLVPV